TLKRENAPELFDVTLTREIIKIQSVKSKMLEKGYGYVRVTQIQERTDDDLERALKNLDKDAGGLQRLVLDLRNDLGGLLTRPPATSRRAAGRSRRPASSPTS